MMKRNVPGQMGNYTIKNKSMEMRNLSKKDALSIAKDKRSKLVVIKQKGFLRSY